MNRRELVEKIHKLHYNYDLFSKENNLKNTSYDEIYAQILKHPQKENYILTSNNHDLFDKNLLYFFSADEINSITKLLNGSQECFVEIVKLFDTYRTNTKFMSNLKIDINENICDLEADGVTILRNIFSDKELSILCDFEKHLSAKSEELFGPMTEKASHYKTPLVLNNNQLAISSYSEKVLPVNHGNTRHNSKNFKGYLTLHPGCENLLFKKEIETIVRYYFKNTSSNQLDLYQQTAIDWMYSAPYLSTPWHFDNYMTQLKIFIPLEDVEVDMGPFYYAKKSHKYNSDIEKYMKHQYFINKFNYTHGRLDRNHWPGVCKDYGYEIATSILSDEHVDNCHTQLNKDPVNIKNNSYEKIIGTAKKGDAIFFDVCGFHSANLVQRGIRKSLMVYTDHKKLLFSGRFFDFICK